MTVSTSTVTPTNISLTPMRVTFNGVDLGGTVNHVAIAMKYDMADIMVDQFGKSIIDKVVNGMVYTIKATISEIKNIDNWLVAFPSGHEIVNGGTKSFYMDMQIGDHLLTHAHALVLHPLENSNADLSGDYKFYKAACMQVSTTTYGPDKQVGLDVEWVIFPDTSVSPARYMTYGDPSNGIVNASAGAAASGSNTGNGTVGSITVSNTSTKTETITILCVGQTSGNNFLVSGSVSGNLGTGNLHLAAANLSTVNFTSSPINFTITQGTVQFAVNDSFTIATTASNFA